MMEAAFTYFVEVAAARTGNSRRVNTGMRKCGRWYMQGNGAWGCGRGHTRHGCLER